MMAALLCFVGHTHTSKRTRTAFYRTLYHQNTSGQGEQFINGKTTKLSRSRRLAKTNRSFVAPFNLSAVKNFDHKCSQSTNAPAHQIFVDMYVIHTQRHNNRHQNHHRATVKVLIINRICEFYHKSCGNRAICRFEPS